MTNSLMLSVFLAFSSIAGSAFAQYEALDIIDLCEQTPELTGIGEYFRNYPEIYNSVYAPVRGMSIFLPSNDALADYANSTTNTLQERGNPFVDQNLYVADNFNPSPYINTRTSTRQNKRADTESGGGEPITLRTAAKGHNLRNLFIGLVFGDSSGDSKRLKERSFENPPEPKLPGITISTGLGKKSNIKWGSLKSKQGIIYILDRVFEFPETASSSLRQIEAAEFLGGVEANGLKEKYDTADQVTIFAPIDGSYNSSCNCSITAASVEAHVVYGAALYNSVLKDGTEFQTCQGKKLKITVQGGEKYVNGVRIVLSDAITLNGVIHTIERPLVDSDYNEYEGTTTTEATPVATVYQPSTGTTGVPAASTTTPLAGTNATTTPLQFMGSASMLGMVDMRVTLGTVVFALAVFMF